MAHIGAPEDKDRSIKTTLQRQRTREAGKRPMCNSACAYRSTVKDMDLDRVLEFKNDMICLEVFVGSRILHWAGGSDMQIVKLLSADTKPKWLLRQALLPATAVLGLGRLTTL